jgi:CBS domain containing-hemolysin-like protein
LLLRERKQPMLLVTSSAGRKLEGIVTKTDLLEALRMPGEDEIDGDDNQEDSDNKP